MDAPSLGRFVAYGRRDIEEIEVIRPIRTDCEKVPPKDHHIVPTREWVFQGHFSEPAGYNCWFRPLVYKVLA